MVTAQRERTLARRKGAVNNPVIRRAFKARHWSGVNC